jgi:predicted transcriptional regulator of viral defense system
MYSANYIATMSDKSQNKRPLKLGEFFSRHAVFTVREIELFLSARESGNANTRKSLLTYHRSQGRIIPVRRGLYATVPVGTDPVSFRIDPYLLASKLAPDAVLSYHTALEFHGKAYTVYRNLTYTSSTKALPLKFQSHEFRGVPMPQRLRTKGKDMYGVSRLSRSGVEIRVTNHERTLVDVLDRPDLTGSWEEIWRSLESVEFFDLDQVVGYAMLLENATTAAKVGYFLDKHRENLMVEDADLEPLLRMRPRQPHYLIRGKRKDCRWVKDWNLMIPKEILNKSWGEVQ